MYHESLASVGEIPITVKTVRSLARGLRTLEAIAALQPIGLTALSQATGEDKSGLQRTLATLHEEGWTRPAPGETPRWELSAKLLILSGHAGQSSSPQARARQLLGSLRDETGETVHLAVVDGGAIVAAEVAQGSQMVRTAIPVGLIHPAETSSAGRAILAHMTQQQRAGLASAPENLLTPEEFDTIRERGWASSEGAVTEGSNSVGAAICDNTGAPVGAVVISGPATRLTTQRRAELGAQLVLAVAAL